MRVNDKRFQKHLEKLKRLGEQYKQAKEVKDMYAEYVPERKKKKVSNIMLVIAMVAIAAYAAANFALQYFTGVEVSPTLTTCWFTFWGTEIFALAGIKITKVIKGSEECCDDSDESCG